ncbi:DUF2637 domain-containing protein [Rhodococcus pyridinivorans]|uniref:DUF2637 domain-containing protein n=1 Tax=Rhodococcus pyridinivorans TaxID=103816 RepID=UPI002658704B|nr:DUF2637 domain-containing protein [Rhodococcus pyridinivorans]
MQTTSRRAARLQLLALIAAVGFSLAIAIAITTGAFVLSFDVLRDLAHRAGIPEDLAFIFPAIVDGAILCATIASISLSKISGAALGHRFFVALLVGVLTISIVGNFYHAVVASGDAMKALESGVDLAVKPLTPMAAGTIAVIPPVLVFLLTHGVGILLKAIGSAARELAATNATDREDVHLLADLADSVTETREASTTPEHPITAPTQAVVAEWNQADAPVHRSAVSTLRVDVDPDRVPSSGQVSYEQPLRDAGRREEITPAITKVEDSQPAITQTSQSLLDLITESKLSENVKAVAKLRIDNPGYSYAAIGQELGVASTTALRRWKAAREYAIKAGFDSDTLDRELDIHKSSYVAA